MAITHVTGTTPAFPVQAAPATAPFTAAVQFANIGDVVIVTGRINATGADIVTGVAASGTGAATFAKVGTGLYNDTTNGRFLYMWSGRVTAAGNATITVTHTGGNVSTEIVVDSFTNSNTATTWSLDGSFGVVNTTASSTATWPSLTPAAAGELYFGYGFCLGTALGTPETGGTFTIFSTGNAAVYNIGPTSGVALAPTATQTGGVVSDQIGALLVASGVSNADAPAGQLLLAGSVAENFTLGDQILRPSSDIATAGWTVAPLFSKINDQSDSTSITATLA